MSEGFRGWVPGREVGPFTKMDGWGVRIARLDTCLRDRAGDSACIPISKQCYLLAVG